MKFEISRDLGHFTGGLIGKILLYSMGYDGFVVNNEFSVIVSADHCSVKSFGDKKISSRERTFFYMDDNNGFIKYQIIGNAKFLDSWKKQDLKKWENDTV